MDIQVIDYKISSVDLHIIHKEFSVILSELKR